uniref:Uncharacterized protein n=1 Tax=Arundo donax TaxID=35708 RepID=A0A0A9AZJ2_ARUDO
MRHSSSPTGGCCPTSFSSHFLDALQYVLALGPPGYSLRLASPLLLFSYFKLFVRVFLHFVGFDGVALVWGGRLISCFNASCLVDV